MHTACNRPSYLRQRGSTKRERVGGTWHRTAESALDEISPLSRGVSVDGLFEKASRSDQYIESRYVSIYVFTFIYI